LDLLIQKIARVTILQNLMILALKHFREVT